MQEIRLLILAFCASKVTLIDSMPETIIKSNLQRKKRTLYGKSKAKEENSEDE